MTLGSVTGWAAGPTCRQRAIAHRHATSASQGVTRRQVGECLGWGHIRHLRLCGFHSGHPRRVPSSSLAGRTVGVRCAGSFAPGLLATQADLLAFSHALHMRGVRWTRLFVHGYLLWFGGRMPSWDSAAPRLLPYSSSGATGCPASLEPPTGPRNSWPPSRSLVIGCILLARKVSNADRYRFAATRFRRQAFSAR
jgi:hypothetical protein